MIVITKGILMIILLTFVYWGLDKLAEEYLGIEIKIYEVTSWLLFIILLTIAVIFTSQSYIDALTVFGAIMILGLILNRFFSF